MFHGRTRRGATLTAHNEGRGASEVPWVLNNYLDCKKRRTRPGPPFCHITVSHRNTAVQFFDDYRQFGINHIVLKLAGACICMTAAAIGKT